ncbi:hypothetical protein BGZ70_008218 [Mortierella alpina]|uniref:Translin n=1 Tax=Mortierella alpina TaxID=64518 RepID=A0A9P6J4G1_MORAP|nr:hypothetical protein BGZ70_008218 [Mortierella alpina]
MNDVHMETPPVSSANSKDPMAFQQPHDSGNGPQTEASVRALLGNSVVEDFGHYRDILEQHDYLPQFSAASEPLLDFKEKHSTVLKLFHRAAIDLQGSNYHRYQRSVSGAMQEYIEAMTLEYYLLHGALMPKTALEADLVFMSTAEQLNNPDLIIGLGQAPSGGGGGGAQRGGKFGKDNRKGPYNKDRKEGPRKPAPPPEANPSSEATVSSDATGSVHISSASVTESASTAIEIDQEVASTPSTPAPLTRLTLEVTDEDYLLGIADLTGELMQERVQEILQFLRTIKSGFDGLSMTKRSPISKKMDTLNQSLKKIELACYNVKVRGAEYPPEVLRQMLVSGQGMGGAGDDNGDAGNDSYE